MHLLFDARAYGQNNGLGRYTTMLLQYLIPLIRANGSIAKFTLLVDSHNQNLLEKFVDNKILIVPVKSRWYSTNEQFEIPRLINKFKPDLVHFPHLNAPLFCPASFIITVHDLTMTKFFNPESSHWPKIIYSLKFLGLKFLTWWNVHRAKKIITVSNFVKNDLLATYHLNPKKITVVYEATTPKKITEVKRAYPAILYVGATYPHKRVYNLLTTVNKLLLDFPTLQFWLVVPDDSFTKKLKQTLTAEQLKFCHFFHNIDEDFLNKLYQQSWIVVQPSESEGFGFQILEAWANGTALACSNSSSLPEIAGEAAAYFPVGDISAIIKTLKVLLTSEDARASLVLKGQERLQQFSWEKCAEQTLNIYQNANQKNTTLEKKDTENG